MSDPKIDSPAWWEEHETRKPRKNMQKTPIVITSFYLKERNWCEVTPEISLHF